MVVTVVGGGNGGLAAAGALALGGHRVRVCDVDHAVVAPVAERGGIEVSGPVAEGFAPVEYAGTDLAQALDGADIVMVVVPAEAHAAAVEQVAPYLRNGMLVVLHPGCTGGALECARVLRAAGSTAAVAETDSFVYACRLLEPGRTHIGAVKARVRVGVLPASARDGAVMRIREVFPQADAASSVLETSLANMNAMLHVGPMLANGGRIEQPERDFEFYAQGITPSVARLVERVDAERVAVCEALGVPTLTLREWIQETYGVVRPTLYEAIQTLHRDVYKTSPAPRTLEHRYLTEDVAAGLVPLEALGLAAGVSVVALGALVTIASAALNRDLRREGRTAERMGLVGLDRDAILELVGAA